MTYRDRLERLLERDIEGKAPGHAGSLAPAVGRRIADRQVVTQRRVILGGSVALGAVFAGLVGGPGFASVIGLLAELTPAMAGVTGVLTDLPQLRSVLEGSAAAFPLLLAIVAALATPFLAEAD